MSVFCQAAVYLLLALPAIAQSQAFATITIKPARSADARNTRVQVLPNGDLIASAVPVVRLLSYAYDLPVNPSPRLSGLPGWPETYDIEAKAPANTIPAGLPESEKRGRMQAMIRGLLADRFKLVMRVEQKTATQATSGPRPSLFLDRALSENVQFATWLAVNAVGFTYRLVSGNPTCGSLGRSPS